MAIARCNARWVCALGVLLSLWLPIGVVVARAQTNPINDVQIEGNQRVEADAIRLHISQRVGAPLNRDAVSNDIKSIYQMGFFRNVTAETRYQNGREILVYHVTERPQITDVKISGMKEVRSTDDKIVAAMKVHPGSIMDPARVNETIKGIKDAYESKGYADVQVKYREDLGPNNTEIGTFAVTEGPRVYIREVDFTGNHAFSARELRSQMDTGTHIPLISLITSVGVLDRKKLDDDIDRIAAFY
ncbi:MAG TPA: POTRA domain-containing protein, partial [Candidatus Binataceae bacterium]|nr:POTRA domain-containing protein [Candidatus Binataceae bacterium]